jgi:hypothetical protein
VLPRPVYLSFLGLIWFAPLDRVVLMSAWSAYIFVGSVLKDRRLLSSSANTTADISRGCPANRASRSALSRASAEMDAARSQRMHRAARKQETLDLTALL